jgi:hypothetical protein
MPIRDTVRDAHRTLTSLDRANARVVARLDRSVAGRGEILSEQDGATAAEAEPQRTVAGYTNGHAWLAAGATRNRRVARPAVWEDR